MHTAQNMKDILQQAAPPDAPSEAPGPLPLSLPIFVGQGGFQPLINDTLGQWAMLDAADTPDW
ncbi:hypothetical protein os1_15530 [Comamonadaceae bacterium OS-1]|nr:hypothetical protein os1_15530 [Comamonadaceae bacterium OS-1]